MEDFKTCPFLTRDTSQWNFWQFKVNQQKQVLFQGSILHISLFDVYSQHYFL